MSNVSRRAALSGLLAAPMIGLGTPLRIRSAAAATKVYLRLDYLVTGEHTHYYVAKRNGYFADEGLDVDILEGAGSTQTLQQLASHNVDFGVAGFDALVNAQQEKLPATMVACIFRRTPAVLLSLKSAGIEKPQDLAGKTVGVRAGSSPTLLLPAFLAASGVDATAVKTISMSFNVLIPALLQKKIDALVGFAPSQYPVLAGSAAEPINIMFYADAGVVTMSTGVVVHPDTIENRPQIVRGFVRAVQRGLKWTLENVDAGAAMMAEAFPQSIKPAEARLAIAQVRNVLYSDRTVGKPLGYMDQADVDDTVKTLKTYGTVRPDFLPPQMFTNAFIDMSV